MLTYIYDNTFEGLLTCIFEIYSRKEEPLTILPQTRGQQSLFVAGIYIETAREKAERVWKGMQKKLSSRNKQLLYYAYLSENTDIEMKIYRFARRLFNGYKNLETDYGDADVLPLIQLAEKVKKEATRTLQFIRFQQTKDDIYFCGISPKYDVIPLLIKHYRERFADQQWMIYDLQRNYGIFYDKHKVDEITISQKEFNACNGQVKQALLDGDEDFYKKLWCLYFKHTTIKERKNLKLQRQFMPRRFWQYLPEMQNKS